MTTPQDADFLIVGSGIAAASVGYWLAPHGRVLLVEREFQPGYHSTGRSAAMFIESYGTPQVRALTRASRSFFERPPPGFSEGPILAPRGMLILARHGQEAQLDEHWHILSTLSAQARLLLPAQARELLPVLRDDQIVGAAFAPDALEMDVNNLHQGYLKGLRQRGGRVLCDSPVHALHHDGDLWHASAGAHHCRAPVVINAAGAWCDEVAALAGVPPIGLIAKRRSAFVFAPPANAQAQHWPMALAADESWYLKPDAGQLLGSPANADPVPAHDVQPEELDIALGIDRIQEMTTLQIRRPHRTWAGLRSFVADGDLVGGFDPQAKGFFWLAAQGGYGIQTSAAMGQACAALARGRRMPAVLADHGLTATMLSPARLRHRKTPALQP